MTNVKARVALVFLGAALFLWMAPGGRVAHGERREEADARRAHIQKLLERAERMEAEGAREEARDLRRKAEELKGAPKGEKARPAIQDKKVAEAKAHIKKLMDTAAYLEKEGLPEAAAALRRKAEDIEQRLRELLKPAKEGRQKERRVGQEGRALPPGFSGFCGRLAGVVEAKVENGFILAVHAVDRVWKNNRAEVPSSAVGKELLINPGWRKGPEGNWQPREEHVRFIRGLERGQRIAVEVINDEGNRLHILELDREQPEHGGGHEARRHAVQEGAREGELQELRQAVKNLRGEMERLRRELAELRQLLMRK